MSHRTSFMRAVSLWGLAGIGLMSCRQDEWLVEVAVTGIADSVRSLEVAATLDGQAAAGIAQRIDQNLQSFVVSLPADTVGELQLTISALGAERCQVAAGKGSLLVDGPGRRSLVLALDEMEAGCRVRLHMVGKGRGKVSLSDGARTTECAVDGLIGASWCEATYPRDRRVTLSYAGTALGGWFGACRGHAESCQVTVTGGLTEVQLDLLQKEELGCSSDFCREQWPVPTAETLYGVSGTDYSSVFAVGEHGTVLHSDGIRWTLLASGFSGRLNAVWSSGPDQLWAVGDGGAILHGENLTQPRRTFTLPKLGGDNLYGVWGSGRRDLWAVGSGGAIWRWQGVDWERVASPVSSELRGIWGSGAQDIWAVGGSGTILHWDGESWTLFPVSSQSTFHAVGGSRSGAVWAVGDKGLIWSWDGNAWQPSPSAVTAPLYAVFSNSEAGPWAVGAMGSLLRLNGGIWDAADLGSEMGAPRRLRGVWGAGAFDLWVVGDDGTILRYRP